MKQDNTWRADCQEIKGAMDKLLKNLHKRSDAELHRMRDNARNKLNDPDSSPSLKSKAEGFVLAIHAELERRHVPGMIQAFRERYRGGFYGEKQARLERNPKLAASQACREILAEEIFAELIEREDWTDIFEREKKLINMTNLVEGRYEKPKLLDTIRQDPDCRKFSRALFDCLYGSGGPSQRLGRFAYVLDELGLSKWTYATYFLFLNEPD